MWRKAASGEFRKGESTTAARILFTDNVANNAAYIARAMGETQIGKTHGGTYVTKMGEHYERSSAKVAQNGQGALFRNGQLIAMYPPGRWVLQPEE